MCKSLRFSDLAAHAPPIASPTLVCANLKQGDRLRVAVQFFSICRALSELKPRNVGGSGEIRTRDQRIKSPLLYRLSYRPPFEEGRMLAATPPTVKLQSCLRMIVAATRILVCIAVVQPRRRGSLPGVMPLERLVLKCGSTLGIERRLTAEFLYRSPPKVWISWGLMT